LLIFVKARPFTDKQDFSVRGTLAGHSAFTAEMKLAFLAYGYFLRHLFEYIVRTHIYLQSL
jgi:hypothetical protein